MTSSRWPDSRTDPLAGSGRASASTSGRDSNSNTFVDGIVILLGLVVTLVVAAVIPVDHDEGQYVAAAQLVARGEFPYKDFIYLQAPFQAFLTAPIAFLTPGYTFIALRFVNAILGAGILASVQLIQRHLQVGIARASVTTALLGSCYVFEHCSGLARNDVLPALLTTLGTWAAILGLETKRDVWRPWLLVGLCFALALSVKITYAIPLTTAGVFSIRVLSRRAAFIRSGIGLIIGIFVGLVPCWIAIAHTSAFSIFFDLIKFHVTAPFAYYASIGLGSHISLAGKLLDAAKYLGAGPGLEVLVAVIVFGILSYRIWLGSEIHSLLLVLTLAGFLAALSPSPTQRQYLLPLLPPLFLLWSATYRTQTTRLGAWLRGAVTAPVVIGAIIGFVRIVQPIADARSAMSHGILPPPFRLTLEAHWIGDRLRNSGACGTIASLSPQVIVDSGYSIDRRFAAGPFFYRTGDLSSDAEQDLLNGVSPRTLVHSLDRKPPLAIVVGNEGILDSALRKYAIVRGYSHELSPVGRAELYIQPGPSDPRHRHCLSGSRDASDNRMRNRTLLDRSARHFHTIQRA